MVAASLYDRLAPVVTAAGYDLEDVVVTPAGKRRMVRVVLDKDGGVTLDECAEVSHAVSAALDEADDLLGQQSYTLEVSSPGVARPLTLPRHWRRNVGRLVAVTFSDSSSVTARLSSATDDAAVLDVDGTPREVAYTDVAKAVVQVELTRRLPGDQAEAAEGEG